MNFKYLYRREDLEDIQSFEAFAGDLCFHGS